MSRVTRTIAISGGKGGVGKTMLSINLAVSLAKAKERVLLFDADLGLSNIDVALGINARKNFSHVLHGTCELNDIIVPGPYGVDILPAASGLRELAQLSQAECLGIIHAFSSLSKYYDVLIIDTPAGISDASLRFTSAAQEVYLVVCNEPSSIADAYAVIKTLHQIDSINKFFIIGNMLKKQEEGQEIFDKLQAAGQRFLEARLYYLGGVLHDEQVKRAIRMRKSLVEKYPSSLASKNIMQIAKQLLSVRPAVDAKGYIEYFIEQLVQPELELVGIKS